MLSPETRVVIENTVALEEQFFHKFMSQEYTISNVTDRYKSTITDKDGKLYIYIYI